MTIVGVLVVVGLVMVLSASTVQSQREFGSTWSYFMRQSIWTAISLGVLAVVCRIDYRRWRPLIPLMVAGGGTSVIAAGRVAEAERPPASVTVTRIVYCRFTRYV